MTPIASVLQSPEAPQSASAVRNQLRNIEEGGAELLELRTEAGVVYVHPSRLQRLRLRWAFRHFHVLPPQVLSRRDQRLIEKLLRSAVVTPALPVPSNTVFGVVEKIPSKLPASADARVTQRESKETPVGQEPGLRQWGALGAVAAVCVAVLLALVSRVPVFSSIRQMKNPQTLSSPVKYAAYDRKPASLHAATLRPSETATVPSSEEPKRWDAPPPPQSTRDQQERVPVASGSGQPTSAAGPGPSIIPAPIVASPATKLPLVSELPQGRVVYPRVSGRNLVGELELKALIGADGSVKEVTVLSGSPKLAEAGVRAVRRWRYNPYQVQGTPVEVETRIKISFFGPDAVSIASAANASN